MLHYYKTRASKYMILFLIGFICGAFCMLRKSTILLDNTGFLDLSMLSPVKHLEVDNEVLLVYVLRQRVLWVVLMLLIATTYLGIGACYAFFVWNGIVSGLICMGCVERLGAKGVLLYVCSIVPQCLFYIPAHIQMAIWITDFCGQLYYSSHKVYKKKFCRFLGCGIFILAVVIMGSVLESYVNPLLFKWILKKL